MLACHRRSLVPTTASQLSLLDRPPSPSTLLCRHNHDTVRPRHSPAVCQDVPATSRRSMFTRSLTDTSNRCRGSPIPRLGLGARKILPLPHRPAMNDGPSFPSRSAAQQACQLRERAVFHHLATLMICLSLHAQTTHAPPNNQRQIAHVRRQSHPEMAHTTPISTRIMTKQHPSSAR